MANAGLVQVLNNDDLVRLEAQQEAEANPAAPPPQIDALAAHIRKRFTEADQFKQKHITPRLLNCQRRRKGEYDATTLAEIKKLGGSEQYVKLTATKILAAKAWIKDVLRRERTWKLVPTPVPDLPGGTVQNIRDRLLVMRQAQFDAGYQPGHQEYHEAFNQAYDAEQKELDDAAEKCAARMSDKIADQLVEGGWDDAFDDLIDYLTTYPSAVFKGLVIKPVRRMKWENGKAAVTEESIPTWTAPDPQDIFPAPNATRKNMGDICEACWIELAELSRMRDKEGWNTAEIEAVLAEGEGAAGDMEPTGEPERASLEERDMSVNAGGLPGQKRAIIYWGNVQGKALAEWGMTFPQENKGVMPPDDNTFYDIEAMLVGNHVVRAILNPDPLGAKPYYWASARTVAWQLWGEAIAEAMDDCQDRYNFCQRHLNNNLALSSWGQIVLDIDAKAEETSVDIYAGKVWQVHGTKVSPGHKAVEYFQTDSNAAVLLQVAADAAAQADDRTLIPRYSYGNQNVSGAAATYGGLGMLMEATAKGIKEIVANVDKLIRQGIEQLYRWNLIYLPDAEYAALKGDVRVEARGVLAKILEDQTQKRRLDMLAASNNPTDAQIIRLKNRAAIWRRLAPDLGMPADDLVMSEDEIAAEEQAQAQAQQAARQQQAGQPAGSQPPQMSPQMAPQMGMQEGRYRAPGMGGRV